MAPNLVTSKSRWGKTGGLMRGRIAGNCDQGSVSGVNPVKLDGTIANADRSLGPANTPVQAATPATPRPFMRSRLFIVFIIIILYFLDFTSKTVHFIY